MYPISRRSTSARAPAGEIAAAAAAVTEGMTTLHGGLQKVRGGETTVAEVARVTG